MKTIDTDPALPHTSSGEIPVVTPAFNDRAREVSEVEIKYLVSDNTPETFEEIEDFFDNKGWIVSKPSPSHLLSRQLDTQDHILLQKGHTLRVRGTCQEGDLNKVTDPDICLKTGKTKDGSGALRRGEYETRIQNFEKIDIPALLQHYPQKQYPEIHQALTDIDNHQIQELFRIDCLRRRYIIEIPEEETGIKNKRFVAEMMLDDIAFILELPGLSSPILFHSEYEVECEALFKACAYDSSPDAYKHVSSSDITDQELDIALQTFDRLLLEATSSELSLTTEGKAERGFAKRQQFLEIINQASSFMPEPKTKNLSAVFFLKTQSNNDAHDYEQASCTSIPLSFEEPTRKIALRR